jgi:opacity protein-like surface antigen
MRNPLSFSRIMSALCIFSAMSLVHAQSANTNNAAANDNYRPYYFFEVGNNLMANANGNGTTVIAQPDAPVGNGNTDRDSNTVANAMQLAVGAGLKLPLLFKTSWLQDNAVEFSVGYFKNKVSGSRVETQDDTIAPPYSIVIANTDYNYDVTNLLVMANYVLDFKSIINNKLTPYVAAGIGFNYSKVDNYSQNIRAIDGNQPFLTSVSSSNQSNFAYNLGFGVKAALNKQLQASLGYRYVNTGNLSSLVATPDRVTQYDLAPTNTNNFNEVYLRLTYQM